MKALKIVAIIVGASLGLAVVVVAIGFIPGVQTWAVRKAVGNQPGMKLDVARVAAGFSSANLDDVRLVKDGTVVTAKRIHATYSAWDYLRRQRLTVHDVAVEDLVIDARAMVAAAEPEHDTNKQPKPFNGILNAAELPFDLQIARFVVPGRILLPDQQTATFELRGSDLTTGKRGTVDWKVDLVVDKANSPLRALRTTGTAALHVTTERRIDSADVSALVSAEGPNLPSDQIKLEARIEQPAAGGNEGYTATVSLVRGATIEQLLNLAGRYETAARQMVGAWKITIRTEQLAGLLRGLGLPDAAANGSGSFTAQPDKGSASASGEIEGVVSHLEKISPALAPVGSLSLQMRFDGGVAEKTAHLGQFALDATTANGRKLAQIKALQRIAFSLADRKVTLADTKADLAHVSLQGLPLAWAQPFASPMTIDSGDLSVVLAFAAQEDGSRIRLTPVEPLTIRNLTVRNGATKLVERLTLTARPRAEYAQNNLQAEIAELAIATPAGDQINGRVTATISQLDSAENRAISFTSDLTGTIIAALKPYLPVDLGPLAVTTKAAGSFAGKAVRLTAASGDLKRQGGGAVAGFELSQPLEVNVADNTFTTAKPDAPTARVRLGQVPLSWVQAFVADSQLSGEIAGGEITVALRSATDLSANTLTPILVRGASAALGGKPMLTNVDAALDFTATRKNNTITYDIRRLEARQGPAVLAQLVAAGELELGEKPTLSAKGSLTADAPALLRQPFAAGATSLSRGAVNATFDATVAETVRAQAVVRLQDLTTAAPDRRIGNVELSVTASVQPDGSSQLNVPFTLTATDRRSDALLEGRLARTAAGFGFDGRLTSQQLFLDDLQALAALAPGSEDEAASPRPRASDARTAPARPAPSGNKPPEADAKAFWAGVNGKVDLDLKQVTYGRDYVISNIRGAATLAPNQLTLGPIEGLTQDKPFRLQAAIDFDPKKAKPYTLTSASNVNEFDLGAFLRAGNPEAQPVIESRVSIDAAFNGTGSSLADLAKSTYGKFAVNGGGGVVRMFARQGEIGQAANIGSALLGVFRRNDADQKPPEWQDALVELSRMLVALPFDKFVMNVERGADLKLRIGHIEFLAPELRFVGRGELVEQPEVPVQQRPMRLTFSIAGKDTAAQLLRKLPGNILSDRQDELGYFVGQKNFTLTGSPTKSDSSDLWKTLGTAVLQNAVERFMGRDR